MPGMRFVCLGVGDAFSARWYSSSLAVESGGKRLLIDCPHPIRKILREAGQASGTPLDVESFDALVLTHLHADHASGLEGWGFYHHFALKTKSILLTHPEVAGSIWKEHLEGTMSSLTSLKDESQPLMQRDDYFDVRPLSDVKPTDFGPYRIECRRTIHSVPTFAMKIRAGGRCLGLSADTSFDPSLIEWLSEADLIVHETNYGMHTPYEKLAALPSETIRKMKLIHYPDDFDLEGSIIEPLIPGKLYEV